MTIIVQGTLRTLPADLLDQRIAEARAGVGHLAVIDDGTGLANQFADPAIDPLISPARGNWDFFADHDCGADMTRAARAITAIPHIGTRFAQMAALIVEQVLHDVAVDPGAHLFEVANRIRAFEDKCVSAPVRPLGTEQDADHDRLIATVNAVVKASAGGFAASNRYLPAVSIRRWLAGSPGRILFIAAGEPAHACRSAIAAIACLRAEVDGLSHASMIRTAGSGRSASMAVRP